MTFNDKKTTGMVFGASNGTCKAIQVNGNNVDWVTNARHLGNVVDNKLSDLKDINAKKVILLRVLTGLWATSGSALCSPVSMFPEPMFPCTDVPRFLYFNSIL